MSSQPFDIRPLRVEAEVRAPGARPLRLAVARAPEDQERGLMFRDSLGEVDGMLFVMPRPDYHAFWMRDVALSLDIAWIDGRGTVVDVAAGVPPCAAPPCPAYAPRYPSKYVLEVVAGGLASRGIARGSAVSIAWL
jgi:uncharacterized membrane protein (UPF0127 family)